MARRKTDVATLWNNSVFSRTVVGDHRTTINIRMTPKEYRAFAKALKKVEIIDVHECADPALEPDAIKRDIAITELERRRLAIESSNNKGTIIARPFFWIIVVMALAGVVIWRFLT